ncbi:zeta-sarcoglycan-like [Biomphalaria glabrata]|uniref:Zeta-sarcoglycan-like n=1 Tax=Biomphalaria glabrata TaxID=6526 RepID=A0A9W3B4I9_BIOGL|nr:zeta-sarcoglycan-like [Biomphalaria glabrata]XP_055894376.1 zeta-sarcoglycan-like [Biomphalaria glabrata]XP_055894377.1 zeta-sarcoglycan-like [Biomphalaria glabrata]XP_055894378.1 zeta-sarcoglycan-like [Biomphalaria glabrata]XP_055894379.1 zeta-sarcoglycan-like [Biomphalaria glabrata]XP_055894380.1 zeta-sarcoglycan-like [Biomphalaria glabrata]
MDHEDANGGLDLNSPPPPPPQPVGIYGWRKRCLYAFVLALMIVVIMNLALTVWILRILRFSLDGMGHLKIKPSGIQVKAEAEFLKTVYVDELKSEGSPLFLESTKSVHLLTTDRSRTIRSRLVLDQENITASCDTFRVVDSNGTVNLLLSSQKVILGNGDATVPGDIKFNGAVFTPTIQSPLNSSLEISSENSKIHITAIGGVSLSSTLANVTLQTDDNMYIQSGALHLIGNELYLLGIPTVDATTSLPVKPTTAPPTVYQLCVCENGKAFLGNASGNCRASSEICSDSTKP